MYDGSVVVEEKGHGVGHGHEEEGIKRMAE